MRGGTREGCVYEVVYEGCVYEGSYTTTYATTHLSRGELRGTTRRRRGVARRGVWHDTTTTRGGIRGEVRHTTRCVVWCDTTRHDEVTTRGTTRHEARRRGVCDEVRSVCATRRHDEARHDEVCDEACDEASSEAGATRRVARRSVTRCVVRCVVR